MRITHFSVQLRLFPSSFVFLYKSGTLRPINREHTSSQRIIAKIMRFEKIASSSIAKSSSRISTIFFSNTNFSYHGQYEIIIEDSCNLIEVTIKYGLASLPNSKHISIPPYSTARILLLKLKKTAKMGTLILVK